MLERGETVLPPCFSILFLYGEIEKQEWKKENENEGKTPGVIMWRAGPAEQGL